MDWATTGGPCRVQRGAARPLRYLSCPWCWRGPEAAGRDSAPLPPRRSLSACRLPRRSLHLGPRYCPPAAGIHNHRCWSFSGSFRAGSWASSQKRKKISTWGDEGGGGRWKGLKEDFFFKEKQKQKPSSAPHDAKRRERGSGPRRGALRGAAKPPPWAERGSGRRARGREGERENAGGRAGARVPSKAAVEPPAQQSSGPGPAPLWLGSARKQSYRCHRVAPPRGRAAPSAAGPRGGKERGSKGG